MSGFVTKCKLRQIIDVNRYHNDANLDCNLNMHRNPGQHCTVQRERKRLVCNVYLKQNTRAQADHTWQQQQLLLKLSNVSIAGTAFVQSNLHTYKPNPARA